MGQTPLRGTSLRLSLSFQTILSTAQAGCQSEADGPKG